MTRPTHEEIQYSLSALERCGNLWGEEGDGLAARAERYRGHLSDGLSFGLFLPIGAAYQVTCLAMAEAVAVTGTKLGEVGTTVRMAAAAYRADEEANVHASQGQW